MISRLMALLLVALVSVTMAACGGDDDDDSGAASANGGDTASCTPKHPGLKTINDGQLTVAVYEYLPYSTYKDKNLGGAEGDMIKQMAKMECLDVNVLYGQAAGAIPAVQSGRADTTIGSWYRTKERAKIVLLGAPELKDEMTIVSKDKDLKTIQDLKGSKVGAVVGYLWVEDLQKLLGDDLKLYQSTDASYQDLANGRVDAVIDGGTSVPLQLKKFNLADAKVAVPPPDDAVGASKAPGQPNMPVNKDNPQLRKALDDDLQALRDSGELEKILKANGFPASAADPGPPNEL